MNDIVERAKALAERVRALRERIQTAHVHAPALAQGRRILAQQLLTECNVNGLINGAKWTSEMVDLVKLPEYTREAKAVVAAVDEVFGEMDPREWVNVYGPDWLIGGMPIRRERLKESWQEATGTPPIVISFYGEQGSALLLDVAEEVVRRCEKLIDEADELTSEATAPVESAE